MSLSNTDANHPLSVILHEINNVSGKKNNLARYAKVGLFDKLSVFYDENKAKLKLPQDQIGIHSVNKENMATWLEKLKEYDESILFRNFINRDVYALFGKILRDNLRYIDFTEYYKKIVAMAREMDTIFTKNKDAYFVFQIDSNIKKSNTWVFMLLFGLIRPTIIKLGIKNNIYFNISYGGNELITFKNNKDIAELVLKAKAEDKTVVLLVPDDMAYSGTQLNKHIRTFYSTYFQTFFNKDTCKFKTYLLIGYMTTIAKKLLASYKNIHFMACTDVIKTLRDCIMEYETNSETERPKLKYLKTVQINDSTDKFTMGHSKLSVVYFDHKIADSVSIYWDIINFGTYPKTYAKLISMYANVGPLINNCKHIPVSLVTKISGLPFDACVMPYYKTITYTLNNSPLKLNSLNEIFGKITPDVMKSIRNNKRLLRMQSKTRKRIVRDTSNKYESAKNNSINNNEFHSAKRELSN